MHLKKKERRMKKLEAMKEKANTEESAHEGKKKKRRKKKIKGSENAKNDLSHSADANISGEVNTEAVDNEKPSEVANAVDATNTEEVVQDRKLEGRGNPKSRKRKRDEKKFEAPKRKKNYKIRKMDTKFQKKWTGRLMAYGQDPSTVRKLLKHHKNKDD